MWTDLMKEKNHEGEKRKMRGILRDKPAAFLDIISELFEFCVPHVLEREDIQSGIFVEALSH